MANASTNSGAKPGRRRRNGSSPWKGAIPSRSPGSSSRPSRRPGTRFTITHSPWEGTIFAGDAAGARLDESGYISVTAAPPQFHLEHTLASVDELMAREPSALYLTHFGAVPDPAAHLAAYREAVELNAAFVRQRLEEGMDAESLRIAYQAFNMEQSFRYGTDRDVWDAIQEINGTAMCADGIRLYWEKQWSGV